LDLGGGTDFADFPEQLMSVEYSDVWQSCLDDIAEAEIVEPNAPTRSGSSI
jgi:hypothetical protein